MVCLSRATIRQMSLPVARLIKYIFQGDHPLTCSLLSKISIYCTKQVYLTINNSQLPSNRNVILLVLLRESGNVDPFPKQKTVC